MAEKIEARFFANIDAIDLAERAEIARTKKALPANIPERTAAIRTIEIAYENQRREARKKYWSELEEYKQAHEKEWSRR